MSDLTEEDFKVTFINIFTELEKKCMIEEEKELGMMIYAYNPNTW
jgi:hypothetical protein